MLLFDSLQIKENIFWEFLHHSDKKNLIWVAGGVGDGEGLSVNILHVATPAGQINIV